MEQVEEKEDMVVSFSWRIYDLPASVATVTEERPLTSGEIKSHGYTWRAVFTKKLGFVFTAGFCRISRFSRDKVRGAGVKYWRVNFFHANGQHLTDLLGPPKSQKVDWSQVMKIVEGGFCSYDELIPIMIS